jgi:rRNA-processing protein FCF1
MKYYIDSCIWLDYYLDRKDKLKPIGEFAFQLLRKIIEEDHQILISEIVFEELERELDKKQVRSLISIVKENLIFIKINHKQRKEAFQSKIPSYDALHAILARDNNAILVSRDKHLFGLSKKPEELI